MNNVIPWWEIEAWFKGHLKKERKKTGRPSYPIILMFKIHLIQQWYNLSDRETEFQICDAITSKIQRWFHMLSYVSETFESSMPVFLSNSPDIIQ